MSSTIYSSTFYATIRDMDHLGGLDQDQVWEQITAAVWKALQDWHEAHPGLLACEPGC